MASARRTEPLTAHQGAEKSGAGGRANAQRERCLAEVLKNHGKTAAEIAMVVGLERRAPSRRLSELREAGLVKNGRSRVCTITGRLGITWFPVSDGAQVPTTGQEAQS